MGVPRDFLKSIYEIWIHEWMNETYKWIYADVEKIILKVISDQIKIIFSKNDFKSDQDHIFLKNDLDLKSRSKIIFCSQSLLFEGKKFQIGQ
jgi:hypothetical protein